MNTGNYRLNSLKPSLQKSGKKEFENSWNNRYYSIKNPNYLKSKNINVEETTLPKINNQNNNLIKSKDTKEDNEEFSLIQNIWDDLGVREEYQNQFLNYVKNLNEEEKKEFYEMEKKNLKRFRDSLLKISKEISNREKNIEDLKKFDEIIETTFPDKEQQLNDQLLLDIQNCIKALRVNSVNIINYMNKIREISTYNSQKGKYNLDKLNSAYLYDPNYLSKMRNDMDFLKNSSLNNYFDMTNGEFDAFLTNCHPKNEKKKSNKIYIPIGNDLMKAIKSAKYSILEDVLLNNIENKKNNNMNLINYNESGFESKSNVLKNKIKIRGISATTRSINRSKFSFNKSNIDYNNLFLKSKPSFNSKHNQTYQNYQNEDLGNTIKKKFKIERDNVPNLTRDEFLRRLDELGKKEEEKNIFEDNDEDEKSLSYYIRQKEEEKQKNNEIKIKNKNREEEKKKKEEEERKRKEEEEERKRKEEEEERKRKEEEEERKRKEEEEERKRKEEEEERKRKEEEEERKRKEEEEERKRKEEEEERKRKEEEEEGQFEIIEDDYDKKKEEDERKRKEEEEERKRKEEEEERKRKEEEEERKRKEEEEERKRKEEEEERKRKEEEEERIQKELEEEERIQKELEEEERKRKEEEEERKRKEEEEERKRKEEEEEEEAQYEIVDESNEEEKKDLERQKKEVLDAIAKEKEQEEQHKLQMEEERKKSILKSSNDHAKEMLDQIFNKVNNDDVKDFNIQFYKGNISDLIEDLNNNNYLEKIPEREKETFKINNKIEEGNLIKGYEPKILICNLKGSDLISALCQIYYEHEFNRTKLIINFLSSINVNNDNDWIEQIEKIINFIKENLSFNEISLVLTYLEEQNGDLIIDKDIKNLFENKLGFKWANIENLENEKRTQTIHFINKDNSKKLQDTFVNIDTLSIITLSENIIDSDLNNDKFINIFSIYSLLSEKSNKDKIKLEKENENSILLDSRKISQYLKDIIGFNLNVDSKDDIEDLLEEKFNFKLENTLYNSEKGDIVTMRIHPHLSSRITLEYNSYYYNRIESDIGVLSETKTNSKFYFIPTKSLTTSIMICQLTSELKELFNNNNNIYETFYSFYSNLIQDSENIKVIQIPCFEYEGQFSSNGLISIGKNVKIFDENNSELYFNTVDQLFNVKMDIDNNMENNFKIKANNSNDEVIIDDDFLLGICNVEILTSTNIPLIQLFIISEENWIKVKK
jgi:hypothetical protein